jgi:proteasome inhibitor subunit 1 (PI31)
LVGPSHPGFGLNPQRGGFPGVLPGARFDPYGPGVPGGGGRGGRGGRGGNMGGPTPDHLAPPGLSGERPDWMYQ